MASYELNLGRTVSRMIPKPIRSPRIYQWLLSLTFPLDRINVDFKAFAKERKRQAEISSQTLILESFLNESFSSYFPDPENDRISIKHGVEIAVGSYSESETPPSNPPYNSGHLIVYDRLETPPVSKDSPAIYFDYEDIGVLPEDFRLVLPVSIQADLATVSDILAVVNRYVLDIKKYDIVYG